MTEPYAGEENSDENYLNVLAQPRQNKNFFRQIALATLMNAQNKRFVT